MKRSPEKRLLFLFFFLLTVLQVVLLFLNEKTFGGADSVSHFQIARYSFKYPQLFLDLWGKPLYTTFSAPFALLGFKGAQSFNLLVAMVTLWFIFKLSQEFFPQAGLFTVVLAAFAPVYFILMNSCLTEVLFSFVLIVSVYFFVKNKYILSALILSFIPYVRSEGIVFFPVFALAFILARSYRSVFFLATGTLFYSLIGFWVFDDILWLIHHFPYPTGESVYGSGSLFHFVKNSNFIFGVPFLVLLITGLFYWSSELLRKFSLTNRNTILFIVIAGSWIAYFAAHSYVWWKGVGGSLGLTRVIGGVIPLAALTAGKGIEFVFKVIKKTQAARALMAVFVVVQIIMFFGTNQVPLKAPPTDKLIEKSATYIQENKPAGRIFYFNPMLVFHLGLDPYDQTQSAWGVSDKIQPSNNMEWGDLLVWDAHFGPNEGGVQLDNLKDDPYLKEIKSYLPLEKITVLGGYDYSIHIFEKNRERISSQNASSAIEKVLTFEHNENNVTEVDGEKVFVLDERQEYGPGITIMSYEIKQKNTLEFNVRLDYRSEANLGKDEVLLIFSVENGTKNLRYEKKELIAANGNWSNLLLDIKIPADLPDSTAIKIYVWNKDRKKVLLKKLAVNLKSY
ncbi:hypothetical protein GM418_06130 [Maribellus comscasis]|uniref:Glycosyltransferase RgtA/B/C/D-like domain-containing protein n=1 Tax=Maribellus comscasis TaxID=2681766 RepID=A0A6I6JQE6_9BACT|nr:hypothetical protein [Maribellus comscasis]QGY43250.1 hypothetical protein GM418_06130 [Maribellus comscasis]